MTELQGEIALRNYLAVLWRRKLIIVGTAFVLVALALGLSLRSDPSYQSSAEVLLQSSVSEQVLSPDDNSAARADSRGRVQTQIEVMLSRSVESEVEEQLGRRANVKIRQIGETEVVLITATDGDPDLAAEEAQVYAEVVVEVTRRLLVQDLLAAVREVQVELDAIRAQITTTEAPLDEIDARLVAAVDPEERERIEAERAGLLAQIGPELQGLRSREVAYATQISELQLASNITSTGGMQIVSDAVPAERPFSPKPMRNAIIGLFLGLMFGAALAFVRDHYDDRIKGVDQLEPLLHGLPVLGAVPQVSTWRNRDQPLIVARDHPQSVTAEAYRALRTSIQFVGLARSVKLVQLTSPNAFDGKTTTVSNLAITLVRAGNRVVVVDCDFRRPRVESFFSVSNDVGMTSVLLGEVTLAEAIRRVPDEPGLAVLPAGPPPPNPSELLSTQLTEQLLRTLAEHADYVLIDSSPLLPVTDAAIVATVVDAVVLVVSAGKTTRRGLDHSLDILERVAAPLIGVVLNAVEAEGGGYYRYGGKDPYTSEPSGRRAAKAAKAARKEADQAGDGGDPGTTVSAEISST